MRHALSFVLLVCLSIAAVAAQSPAGWKVRADRRYIVRTHASVLGGARRRGCVVAAVRKSCLDVYTSNVALCQANVPAPPVHMP